MTDHFAQDVVAARQHVKQCEAETKDAADTLKERRLAEATARRKLMTLIDECDQPRLPYGRREED